MQQKLSVIITAWLLVVSAWTLGDLVWMVGGNTSQVAQWTPPMVDRNAAAHKSLDVSKLEQSHLFGVYKKKDTPVVAQVVQNAPKTTLNLILVGTVASSEPNQGVAVIANQGQQATYGINDVIKGTRAKLKAVLIDRVIIDNNGRDETLMLQGVKYSRLSEVSAKPIFPVEDSNMPAVKRQALIAKILEQPRTLLQYVRFSPVKRDGQSVGFRISPGASPELFTSLGLKSGDIATEINGLDLTDPANLDKVFQGIVQDHKLNITIERDGQQRDVNINM
nr:type II secretion system protein GspC [Vibrio sinus]